MNYLNALYRRNNFGQPCVWYAEAISNDTYIIKHGIIGKTITQQYIHTHRDSKDEIESKIKDKRKSGYKFLSEIKDDTCSPVEGELLHYLNTYLPNIRTNANNNVLAMLAKSYDNKNNKLFNKVPCYIGQYKINGLRCFISAKIVPNNIFKHIGLEFQSREGEIWDSLTDLEDYLLEVIPYSFLERMVEEHIILDGEVYLPGYSVNQINHFVKDPKCYHNKLLQFWCYDIAIEDTIQIERYDIICNNLYNYNGIFNTKEEHLLNKRRLILLNNYQIYNDYKARLLRDEFIRIGFEGLIMRNPYAEYQFGKRNLSMIKYKSHNDGKFEIIDIYPEGTKRANIPLFLCKNDINDNTFECHVGGSIEYQSSILINKDKYIGKYMFIEFGERSGVTSVPFHIKGTHIINE